MGTTWEEERFDDNGTLRFSRDGRPLEHAIRSPIKNANWHLVRRLNMASTASKVTFMPKANRMQVITTEEKKLEVLEERRTLALYISEIKSTKNWFGTGLHFPTLVIDSDDLELGIVPMNSTIPLKWTGQGESEEYKFAEGPSENKRSKSTSTTTSPRHDSSSDFDVTQPSVDSTTTSEGDDDASRPLPGFSQSPTFNQSDNFRPSYSLTNKKPRADPAVVQLARNKGITIEPNYEGELTVASLRARTCPANQSAALYIKNVESTWTTTDILDCIQEGGIYKYSRQESNFFYNKCAVSLTFKHRRAAVHFLNRAINQGIYVQGTRLEVIPSRNHCPGVEQGKSFQTRVLEVTGAADVLDADELEAEFHNNIRFVLVKRVESVEDGQKTVQFHFEGILGQSRAAFVYLNKNHTSAGKLGWGYAPDLCAVDGN